MVWDLSGNELTRNSSGNIRSELSQLAEPLWTDPDLKSGISERELISTSKKKKKKAQAGNDLSNILPKSSQTRKKRTAPQTFYLKLLKLKNKNKNSVSNWFLVRVQARRLCPG